MTSSAKSRKTGLLRNESVNHLIVDQCRQLLSGVQVIDSPEELKKAETTTFSIHNSVLAILKVSSTEQVQQVFHLANELGISVYPTSRGKNWGYGSRVPTRSDCLLLDLGHMNKVIEFNEEYGFIRVEPGVTIKQIHDYLQSRNSSWINPPGGMTPEASLIGNVMERGFAAGRAGERINQVCDFEVVLPTGEKFSTGLSRFPQAHAKNLYRHGLGPSLDGLFSQSNLGIVTQMTLWLTKRPGKHFQTSLAAFNSDQQMASAINELRSLAQNGTIGFPFAMWNSLKIAAIRHGYPWTEMANETPLRKDVEKKFLSEKFQMPVDEWNLQIGLYSSSFLEALAKRITIFSRLRKKTSALAVFGRIERFLVKLGQKPFLFFAGIDPVEAYEVGYKKSSYFGVLSTKGVTPLYWRKKSAPSQDADPDMDGCGLIWCTSVIPFHGEHVDAVVQSIRESMNEFGFETMITLIFLSERHGATLAAIKYDRAIPGEDEKAMSCYKALQEKLISKGYPPYRLGLAGEEFFSTDKNSSEVLRKLKIALDPNGILAPGRYDG